MGMQCALQGSQDSLFQGLGPIWCKAASKYMRVCLALLAKGRVCKEKSLDGDQVTGVIHIWNIPVVFHMVGINPKKAKGKEYFHIYAAMKVM